MKRTPRFSSCPFLVELIGNSQSIWIDLRDDVQRAVDFIDAINIGLDEVGASKQVMFQTSLEMVEVDINQTRK